MDSSKILPAILWPSFVSDKIHLVIGINTEQWHNNKQKRKGYRRKRRKPTVAWPKWLQCAGPARLSLFPTCSLPPVSMPRHGLELADAVARRRVPLRVPARRIRRGRPTCSRASSPAHFPFSPRALSSASGAPAVATQPWPPSSVVQRATAGRPREASPSVSQGARVPARPPRRLVPSHWTPGSHCIDRSSTPPPSSSSPDAGPSTIRRPLLLLSHRRHICAALKPREHANDAIPSPSAFGHRAPSAVASAVRSPPAAPKLSHLCAPP